MNKEKRNVLSQVLAILTVGGFLVYRQIQNFDIVELLCFLSAVIIYRLVVMHMQKPTETSKEKNTYMKEYKNKMGR